MRTRQEIESDQAQYEAMEQFREDYDDLPDGAFFALAEELHDWSVDDWVWLAEYKPDLLTNSQSVD